MLRKLKKSDLEKMRKLREKGVPIEKIARKFNVSITTVRYHLFEKDKEILKKYAAKAILKYNIRWWLNSVKEAIELARELDEKKLMRIMREIDRINAKLDSMDKPKLNKVLSLVRERQNLIKKLDMISSSI